MPDNSHQLLIEVQLPCYFMRVVKAIVGPTAYPGPVSVTERKATVTDRSFLASCGFSARISFDGEARE